MRVVREPAASEAVDFLREELARMKTRTGHLVQVLGGCTVDYQGRAASTLDQGERLILLKPDGTLLVHTSTKAKPVNWMPPGANEFSVAVQPATDAHGDQVVLTAMRRKPHQETVRITFHDILLLQALPLRDSEELVLRRTEGDLHQLFFERPGLIEPGLVIQRGEKGTRRGPLDLWGTDDKGNRVIVEVKRSKAGIAEATQLWRYVEMERNGRFQEHLDDGPVEECHDGAVPDPEQLLADKVGHDHGPRIRGILVCPGISDKALQMLTDHRLEHVSIDWDDLLAHLDAHRSAGQATLVAFGGGGTGRSSGTERTVRTGKKR